MIINLGGVNEPVTHSSTAMQEEKQEECGALYPLSTIIK